MSDESKIEWCDSTFNPWIGCTKIGPGCDHCYAEADFDLRKHRVKWGAGNPRSRTSAANWKKPLQWDRQHAEFFAQHGRRRRVFCASLADVFDNEVPMQWRADLFALIDATPNLDWLILTKRIGNADRMMVEATRALRLIDPGREILRNVWLGATICNQPEADRDIAKLLAVPAAVHWLSMEPLLESVDLTPWLRFHWPVVETVFSGGLCKAVDWVVVGGESGPRPRPMNPEWARSLRDQCAGFGVPFLFKQYGEWSPAPQGSAAVTLMHEFVGDGRVFKVGKKAAGRLLDGVQHDGYPEARP